MTALGFLQVTRVLLLSAYALLLLPALLVGLAAMGDYRDRGCQTHDGNQCSDAVSVMTLVGSFLFAVPAIWLSLGIPARRLKGEPNA